MMITLTELDLYDNQVSMIFSPFCYSFTVGWPVKNKKFFFLRFIALNSRLVIYDTCGSFGYKYNVCCTAINIFILSLLPVTIVATPGS